VTLLLFVAFYLGSKFYRSG